MASGGTALKSIVSIVVSEDDPSGLIWPGLEKEETAVVAPAPTPTNAEPPLDADPVDEQKVSLHNCDRFEIFIFLNQTFFTSCPLPTTWVRVVS